MKIIGLCGPSCSGKSTIAKNLAELLDANILSTDQFYKKNSPKIYVDYYGEKIRTFERKCLYDGDKILDIINDLNKYNESEFESMNLNFKEFETIKLQKKEFLILEGFLLYTYEKLFDKINYKFYLDICDSEILKRRKERGERPKSDFAFEKIGLSEYKEHGEYQKELPNVIVINALDNKEKIISEIYNEIKN
jgi:uridine kinase